EPWPRQARVSARPEYFEQLVALRRPRVERQVRDQFKRPCAQAATASLGAGDRQRPEYADLRPIGYWDHVWRRRGELDRRRPLGRGDAVVRQRGRGTLGREDYERWRLRSRRVCAPRRPGERIARSRNRCDGRPGRRP